MADRIEVLLGKTKLPLTFVVFIPEWLDPPATGLVKMLDSKFKTETFIANKGEHEYISGSQYMKLDNNASVSYVAVHETRAIVLQNSTGREKWSITEQKIDKLKESMKKKTDKR